MYRRYEYDSTDLRRLQGGYVKIYLKIIILKNYMHRARVAPACALAPHAKVGGMHGGMSLLWTIHALNSKSCSLGTWGIFSCFHRWVVGLVNRSIGGEKL
jgi:hypothetical protein